MKVLVVGGGAREHAIVWKLSQSPRVEVIYAAPGNAGIAQLAEIVNIDATKIAELADFVQDNDIEYTIVGPEAPLVAGIVDEFERRGLKCFGPTKAASQIEGSKVFSKGFMMRHGIPTASYQTFKTPEAAIKYLETQTFPLVIKADGLAAGKGVFIAPALEEAQQAIHTLMVDLAFGKAGTHIVVEEFLQGQEASFMAFVDGEDILIMPASQDHKAIYDGDTGPNTGGMGAYTPVPIVTPEIEKQVIEQVLKPFARGMVAEGMPYRGVIYPGIIITPNGIRLLEFNCRFGDPETEVILPMLDSDLVDIIEASFNGTLGNLQVQWKEGACVCVVMASDGYPGKYETGKLISGLEQATNLYNTTIFHFATTSQGIDLVTNGGRVLAVTAQGFDLVEAQKQVYEAVNKISFENAYFRKDIAAKAFSTQTR